MTWPITTGTLGAPAWAAGGRAGGGGAGRHMRGERWMLKYARMAGARCPLTFFSGRRLLNLRDHLAHYRRGSDFVISFRHLSLLNLSPSNVFCGGSAMTGITRGGTGPPAGVRACRLRGRAA